MEPLIGLLTLLNSLSPLAVIGLLATIIYIQMNGKTAVDQKVQTVATNHLHDLPEMSESLKRIESLLQSINENIIYVRARVNGGGPRV